MLSISSYKNIIFDLGGVLINIDYSLLVNSFEQIGLPHFQEYFSKASQRNIFDLYEKGMIDSAQFRNELRPFCKEGTTDDDIENAWNAMLLDFPKARLDMLLEVRKTHRSFLLSNTNEIHMRYINKYLQFEYGQPDLSAYFEKVYLSYEMGMRKPDAEIFQKVLDENGLNASETLFIDDSPQHVEGAAKTGIHAYLLDVKKEDVLELIE
jgi:glucose-1-phosphatase